ncbi:Panacea domain-containing protein [Agrobacterium sp. BA1120]|uniref:Panacea domain-containing protein n=1 Tax=Agrobacterium sp. BA1120 TaxID=3228927 RepID=UPI000DDE39AB
MRAKAPIIDIKPNAARILEALVFLISEADRLHKSASQYDIVKSLFLSDRRHLNEYGRPITFDRYVAMEHGPVPSNAYDLLKSDPSLKNLPWTRVQTGHKVFQYSNAQRSFDENILSESDCEALYESFITVKSLGFQQIRKLTHEDPAYVDAWDDESDKKAFVMSYAMLYDFPAVDKAQELKFISEHI